MSDKEKKSKVAGSKFNNHFFKSIKTSKMTGAGAYQYIKSYAYGYEEDTSFKRKIFFLRLHFENQSTYIEVVGICHRIS